MTTFETSSLRTRWHGARVGGVGQRMRRLDGAVVDHGDDGHGKIDSHGVNISEAEETQEGEQMTFPE